MRYKEPLLAAIKKEIALQQSYLGSEEVNTVYFGGGTPSLCSSSEVAAILSEIKARFSVNEDAEITLESNPDDITEKKLAGWKEAGINRLSIGIQSFFDEDLQWMNRAHSAEQATESLELALQFFKNITIDLIYGSPGLTNDKWKKNVETAISFGVPHISCYALTVEARTPLAKKVKQKEVPSVDTELQAEQFLLLIDWLGEAGYEHYEISNFAKPGWRSKHNSAYWEVDKSGNRQKYLGLGPAAHSYNGSERQWNIANNSRYISSLAEGKLPFEKEILTPVQQLNEYIMTSLRTEEGLNLEITGRRFNVDKDILLNKAKSYLEHGKLVNLADRLILTKQGKLLADGIAADLFF